MKVNTVYVGLAIVLLSLALLVLRSGKVRNPFVKLPDIIAKPTVAPVPTVDPKILQAYKDLKIEDVLVGEGKEAVAASKVKVHYAGLLTDGTPFDSSEGREPLEFTIASGQMIPGFDKGVYGMKVGGKRKLTIPSPLGYGDRQVGAIPPNSTLVFEVELVDVQ